MNAIHKKSLLPVYIKGLCSGKYTLKQASQSTGYTENWLCILKHKYLRDGVNCLEHKNKNRVPVNKTPESVRQKIAAIYAGDFADVNFSYYRKYLAERHGIKISEPTLKMVLSEYGLKSPEAHRVKKIKTAKRPRLRRANEGDMIQIDGTPFAWFYKFGDNTRYCLSGAIDDATGKITGLYMTKHECLYGYIEILRQTCDTYGVPREIYSDRAAIFCVTPNKNKQLDSWERLAVMHGDNTQWQRILKDLQINQILAWSPEAKGRVERMWRTIQGQLPVWLKLREVETVESANRILNEYAREFNNSYAVAPDKKDDFWLATPDNLSDILQCRISRKTDGVGVFSFHSYKFAIRDYPFVAYRKFELCISERGIYAYLDGAYHAVECIDTLLDGLGETMPQVLQELVYRYLFAYAKEISA